YVHYWGHRDYAAALAEFAKARADLPNDASIIAAVAYVHRRQGDLAQAISGFEQAAALDPRNARHPGDLCNTLVYLRRYGEAVAACDRALALAPDDIEVQGYRAAALRMRGDFAGASRSLSAIPAGYDPLGSASLARFDLALAMRQPDAALAALAQAPAWLLDTGNDLLIPATLLRGRALALKREDGSARAAYLDAQRTLTDQSGESRDPAGAQSNLADVYAGLGQKDAALAAARRATDLMPPSRDMLSAAYHLARLAKIEAQFSETGGALNHIEELLAAPAGREVSAASLRTDPAWDPLRKDPRFQKLIADAEAAQAKIKP
ncbi:MAG TPA: tetratricopeptide repeat protein, partial [Xanthomonadaceae bacterium]|nr:tetratricopeptide repeat protein [Xanthomonadaceae bacterium]